MEITNVIFSSTNIKDQGITLTATISGAGALKYKISVNSFDTGFTNITPPTTINRSIPANDFILGNNLVTLKVTNLDETIEELFTYNIIKEDRDTFTYQRRLEHDQSHSLNGLNLQRGEGIAIEGLGQGSVTVKIPTEGKARVQNITSSEVNSGIVVGNLEIPMLNLGVVGEYSLREAPIDNSVEDILSIGVSEA
jgi:hypothetical protein